MNNPGIYNLGQRAITAALTDHVLTEGLNNIGYVGGLEGMLALNLVADFDVGTAGSGATVGVTVQTRFGSGGDWIDIAQFDFTTASAKKVANLSGLISKAVTADPALSAEGVVDGVLGDRLRAIVTSTGTYGANCNITVTASAR